MRITKVFGKTKDRYKLCHKCEEPFKIDDKVVAVRTRRTKHYHYDCAEMVNLV